MRLKNKKLSLVLLGLIVLPIFIWWYTKPSDMESKGLREGLQAFNVKTIHPQHKSMPIVLQELGSVKPEESVNIVSQVSGTLRKIRFTEGQMVKTGQILFEIEASFYQADVSQAEANLKRDQAQLDFLKATANRYKSLAKLEYITRQQYEESLASVQQQEAVVAADQALLEQKKIQLSYTHIRSPINGKTGEIHVHVGDLISANSTTPLVVINRLENVLVDFSIPQHRLGEVISYQRAGDLKITVFDENGEKPLAQGELVFVGNVVSGQTGTIQMKGKVANQELLLWPGQLVTVQLIFGYQANALVIPSASVQLGQKGHYVYVVKNNKAVIQLIKVDRLIKNETVVAEGLTTEDTVISEIPPGMQEGSPVKLETQKSES